MPLTRHPRIGSPACPTSPRPRPSRTPPSSPTSSAAAFVESVHRASVAVTASDGSLLHGWGAPGDPVFPRSSNKPLQSVGMLRAGLTLPAHQLALASASHSAEPFHLDAVRDMLAAAGLTEADLQNTPDLPYDPEERDIWVAAGRPARSLSQNCSGKHAAMLATCRLNGWDLATYRDLAHPLQRAMAAAIADLAGEPIAATAVDGCGAPVMAISLTGLARAFGRIASADSGTPREPSPRRSAPPGVPRRHAARRHRPDPRHRGRRRQGRRRVRLCGRPRPTAAASPSRSPTGVSARVRSILAGVLRRLGVESTAYDRLEDAPVLGHGEPVGAVVAVGLAG